MSDINARVAARNGDGYPCLVSKAFGTDGGVLVYYTDPPKDKDLLGEGPAYIKTILDNAISTPTSTMTAGTRRKAVLLVETVSSSVNPNVFTLLEQQLDPDNTDLLQTTNWDATGVWAAYYRTIVIAVNGGSPSSTSIKNVEKLVSAGVRVVMLGGSADSTFQTYMYEIPARRHLVDSRITWRGASRLSPYRMFAVPPSAFPPDPEHGSLVTSCMLTTVRAIAI